MHSSRGASYLWSKPPGSFTFTSLSNHLHPQPGSEVTHYRFTVSSQQTGCLSYHSSPQDRFLGINDSEEKSDHKAGGINWQALLYDLYSNLPSELFLGRCVYSRMSDDIEMGDMGADDFSCKVGRNCGKAPPPFKYLWSKRGPRTNKTKVLEE